MSVTRLFLLATLASFLSSVAAAPAQQGGIPDSEPERGSPADLEGVQIDHDTAIQAPVGSRLSSDFLNKVTIGTNLTISQLFKDSSFIPPDTMGAVGPRHVVELINGNFEVFDKATGKSVFSTTLDSFWKDKVGQKILHRFTFDPRILYDPDCGQWFAVSIDSSDTNNDGNWDTPNNIYLGRSDTDDPTGDWDGRTFPADTTTDIAAGQRPEFHDYPTLALDANALYICTQDFSIVDNRERESCYSIPKQQLCRYKPLITKMTRFEETPVGMVDVRGSWQVARDFGPSRTWAPMLGSRCNNLNCELWYAEILESKSFPARLGAVYRVQNDPGHSPPALSINDIYQARQPDNPDGSPLTIENVAPRFVGNVVKKNDYMWAVHSVRGQGIVDTALRWYKIAPTPTQVLKSGLIENANEDFHEPSIAVNALGDIVVGYTCSGPSLPASSCVSIGETQAFDIVFEKPQILALGQGRYYVDYNSGRNRWGDYSATVVDPQYQCAFWTFQEFVAQGAPAMFNVGPGNQGGIWGIQVTELIIDRCAEAICDVDEDKDVDLADLRLIGQMRGESTPPANPLADFDGNGVISINDARACVTKCTRPNCATE